MGGVDVDLEKKIMLEWARAPVVIQPVWFEHLRWKPRSRGRNLPQRWEVKRRWGDSMAKKGKSKPRPKPKPRPTGY